MSNSDSELSINTDAYRTSASTTASWSSHLMVRY